MFQKKRPLKINTNRQFWLNQQENTKQFPSNFVKTSKYNIFDFFPSTLYQQFCKFANIYFLVLAILQSIPQISPLTPVTAIAPLVFVLSVSMSREAYEDYERHKQDEISNSNTVLRMILSSKQNKIIESVKWKNIIVGDLLYIKKDEAIPADIVILSSSNQDSSAYINTSSLDGEKTLKPKESFKKTQDQFNPQTKIQQRNLIHFHFQASKPDPYINHFEGSIVIDEDKDFLFSSNFAMRGSYLKNTRWIIGVVVYTGYDTKIMRNEEKSKVKVSSIEQTCNKFVVSILCFQTFICILLAVVSNAIRVDHNDKTNYLVYVLDSESSGFLTFFTYLILTNTMLPISLLVSLEFVKLFQSYFMGQDDDLNKNKHNLLVNTSSINEELGMVEYIFSDKTGTLTCNKMDFKYYVIGTTKYGLENQDDDFNDPQLSLEISKINDKIQQNYKYEFTQTQLIYEFFLLLSTCHECIIEQDDDNAKISYQGLSPDEITLVDQASKLGFNYLGKNSNSLQIGINGNSKNVEILYTFPFDSDRKRMSVIIRDKGCIKLYCKGADSIIIQRLSKQQNTQYLQECQQKLNDFSLLGLRTLCMAMRIITEEELKDFETKFRSLADQENRQELILNLAQDLESELHFLGVTAIEDKLQPNVHQVIQDFLASSCLIFYLDIKVWMLTGDKLETAENIARSCNLIEPQMDIIYIREEMQDQIENTLKLAYIQVENNEKEREKKRKSLIIEGHSLRVIQKDQKFIDIFLNIVLNVESVVCCRATPRQKAEMVRLIRTSVGKITLAIGDGANDCNMIQEANIGIGIFGKNVNIKGNEGMQAVLTSDFAIGEFQCLHKLIFVHGRQNYIRISNMILYFFYKNMLFTIPQFYFAFQNMSSGQSCFDAYYISGYNMIFTAFPLIITATFDQTLSYKKLITQKNNCIIKINQRMKTIQSKLYYIGQNKTIFNSQNFYFYVTLGLFHSLIIFLIISFTTAENYILNQNGHVIDLWVLSINEFTIIIIIANLINFIFTKYWTILNFVVVFVFFIIYLLFIIIYNQILNDITNAGLMLLQNSYLYLQSILIVGIVFLSYLFCYVLHKDYAQDYHTKAELYFQESRDFNETDQINQKIRESPNKSVLEKSLQPILNLSKDAQNSNDKSKNKKQLYINVENDDENQKQSSNLSNNRVQKFQIQHFD